MSNTSSTGELPKDGRPRLLFLSHHLPFPPDSGAAIRTGNVLRLLSEAFDVTALCLARGTDAPGAGSLSARTKALACAGTVEAYPIPSEISRARNLADHLRAALMDRPYVLYMYDSKVFRTRLAELLRSAQYDLVHVDSLDLAAYLPMVMHLPVVCVHHNIESNLLLRRARAEGSYALRAYLHRQAALLRALERRWCSRISLNVVVSAEDRRQLQDLVPKANVVVHPNGVDLQYYRPEPIHQDGLAFVGGTTWFPNQDALQYFCEDILPLLHAEGQYPAVRWIGKSSEKERQRFASVQGLTLTGYLEDERPELAAAACFIVPLRVGGGTRLKILNAWSMGKAVVSTSVGCEGLNAIHGENILIADDPLKFSNAVAAVLDDVELRNRLGAAARLTVERTYGWPSIGARIIADYQELLRSPMEAAGYHAYPPSARLGAPGRYSS